ncbi:TPA: hypothetical protein L9U11_005135, partial [Klebsiella pneumoniae]|nr:hypothetical protein [Klebsiella pneumoniae]
LYNSKRPHKSLELMTPVDYILRESKNCNMWWTHTSPCLTAAKRLLCWCLVKQMASCGWLCTDPKKLDRLTEASEKESI